VLDVQLYEAFEEEEAALRRCLPSAIRAGFTWKTIQEQNDTDPPARLISIRTQSVIPLPWLDRLLGVASRTTGYDHLISLPLPCGYLPTYCSRAVAEQAILLVLALLRKLPRQMAQLPRFSRDGLTGSECAGKHLLVVGVGHIGSEVIRIGRALGMDARGVDIVRRHDDVAYLDRDEGLAWAEAIVCAMNLTRENTSYFDYATLRRAKRGVLFVNVARGELSPAADLVRLLDEGHLGGLGLDVYEDESRLAVTLRTGQPSFPLLGRPDVILTPHNAFNTAEALDRKARHTADQIAHFLAHGAPLWPVPRP
jgi:D-lactate dehydrogenase